MVSAVRPRFIDYLFLIFGVSITTVIVARRKAENGISTFVFCDPLGDYHNSDHAVSALKSVLNILWQRHFDVADVFNKKTIKVHKVNTFCRQREQNTCMIYSLAAYFTMCDNYTAEIIEKEEYNRLFESKGKT
jgi:hypothetical protein